jgi:hypothetical protein
MMTLQGWRKRWRREVCDGVLWSHGGVVLDRSIHRPQRAVWPVGRPHALEVPAA